MDKECEKRRVKLEVLFEEPFWVAVLERYCDGGLSACKVTFGAEPKDYEVSAFLLEQFYRLKFSPAVAAAEKETKKNPKRIRREIEKSLRNPGIGTKSQQALKLQQEQMKTARKQTGRKEKEAEKQKQFDLKQQKKKEKHRGR